MVRGAAWIACAAVVAAAQCRAPRESRADRDPTTRWDAWLESPGGPLHFGLELTREPAPAATLVNGAERLAVPEVELDARGAWVLRIPYYDSTVRARPDGGGLVGSWTKVAGPDRRTTMVLRATPARRDEPPAPHDAPGEAVAGRWRVDFSEADAPAVGVFEAGTGDRVSGTFLTELGDYRFLAGRFDGEALTLSCFDGAHAFLFTAALAADGALHGDFWSRDSWHETWTAHRDPEARLADPFGLSTWTDAMPLGELAFPDTSGRLRALDDPAFAGRARVIQLFGTWCPNCNDEAPFLAELDRRWRDRGLSILGLAFELTGDFERDARQVRRYAEHHGIEYPILVAGLADKQEASRRFPLLDRVRAFPTTIFLDGRGHARAVHTGFAGPATGAEYQRLRADFERLIEQLLTTEDER